MIARLTCLDDSRLPDDQKGLIIELDGSEVSIGRGVDNTQVIQHSSISRRHALIVPDDAGLLIRDLKSTNGVWLNGERTDEPCSAMATPWGLVHFSFVSRLWKK